MKLITRDNLKKLQEAGPRKKDRVEWNISKKDINQSNYNVWHCWISIVIDYLEKRAERSAKIKKSVSVNSKKA
jgi:hypothetical protein